MPRSYADIVRLSESMADSIEADTSEPTTPSTEAAVRAAALRRALAEAELGDAVKAAREADVSWDRIGKAVGTSGEAARQKYRFVIGRGQRVRMTRTTRSVKVDRSTVDAVKEAAESSVEPVSERRGGDAPTHATDGSVRAKR
jgi:hypothetical protein